jgi:DNA polymerase-3 subunit delta'
MIVGHKIQREFLKKSFESSRISHAYLFSGVDGLGKKTVALEFVRMINGQKKDLLKSQPDLIMVEPQPSIQISQIREMRKALILRPFSAPFKTVIIDEAEKMTDEAQNCILKTLEEPKGQAVLFLISSSPERLFETVRSRTQCLKFYPLSSGEMRDFLKPKIPSSDILERLIFISEGRPGKAIDFLRNPQKLKVWWQMFEDIQNLVDSDISFRFKYLNDFFQEDNSKEFLNIFLRYFRLVLLSKLGVLNGFKKSYSRAVVKGEEESLLSSPSLQKIKEIIELGEKIKFLISRTNINQKLALETLFLNI